MRSLEDASASWQELKHYKSLLDLRRAVRLDGRSSAAASAGLRSACWKAFLLFDSIETSEWPRLLAQSRSAYDAVRTHFLRHLEDSDEAAIGFDPLSEQAESSPWTTLRKDNELRAEIQQDVDRCMPENLYFRQPETQRTLLDVLFVFCKLNPDVSYRQGMHEIVAPILWVVERDAIQLGPSSKTLGEDASIQTVFDAEHIEHDTFALFGQVMQNAKNFYEQSTHAATDNPMVLRSQRIFNELLPQVDPQLAKHLAAIDIVPQVFLMRWIRLLFGREFSFDDALTVWDVIFAEDVSLELVDYICVAMLLRIRWELLDADYNAALTLLLRYPYPVKEYPPQTFVLDALYLRDHLDTDGSGYLVLRYTGRPMQPINRSRTPPALQRNITTFSGDQSLKPTSPSRTPRSSGSLEATLQSTVKNIYARGERLGIGKAVRSAVDEVHKRAQEIRETPTPSRASVPRTGYGALQSKIKALEERNKQLSKMLEGAVGELWEYQRLVTDGAEAKKKPAAESESESQQEAESSSEQSADKLGIAIAKVQFVQVYLEDMTLPLQESVPHHENSDAGEKRLVLPSQLEEYQTATSTRQAAADSHSASRPSHHTDPLGSDTVDTGATAVLFINEPEEHVAGQAQATDSAADSISPGSRKLHRGHDASRPIEVAKASIPRPSLEQSSFSWMLDQHGSQSQTGGTGTTFPSARARNKGFLFGDDGGDDPNMKASTRSSGR